MKVNFFQKTLISNYVLQTGQDIVFSTTRFVWMKQWWFTPSHDEQLVSTSVTQVKSFPQSDRWINTIKFLPVWGSAAELQTPSGERAGCSLSLSLRSPWLYLPLLSPLPLLLHCLSLTMERAGLRRRSASPWHRAGWGQRGSQLRSCSSWRYQRERG